MTYKPTIIIDFDGVIHSYTSGWTRPDEIRDGAVPGAMDWLREATEHFKIAILSSRSHEPNGINAMMIWLENEAAKVHDYYSWIHRIEWPEHKIPAILQIDDRAFLFKGTFPSIEEIKSFKPWNKT